MRKRSIGLLLALLAALVSNTVSAKRNVPEFPLEYRPTQAVGTPDANASRWIDRPVAFEVQDARTLADPSWIGTRTDDDDVIYDLTATNDVLEWVDSAVRRNLANWGVTVEPAAEHVLRVELVRFSVDETNQAVGAMYTANVRLRFRMLERRGAAETVGMGSGEASRYGKKFSPDNANEVLSDALIDAVAHALDRSAPPAPEPAPGSSSIAAGAGPVSPRGLLEEIRSLLAEGLTEETILTYVRGRTLSSRLTADDLVEWKKAGVPEEVLRTVLDLPVR